MTDDQQEVQLTPEGKSEQQTKVRMLMDSLKEATINEHNYKQWIDKVANMQDTIMSLIENMLDDHQNTFDDYKKKEAEYIQDVSKDQRMQTFVYADMHKLLYRMHRLMKDVTAWKTVQIELNSILVAKISITLGETQALDIKKQALQEMRQQETDRHKAYMEMLSMKDTEINGRFMSGLQTILREQSIERREMIQLTKEMISQNTAQMSDIMETLVKQNMMQPGDFKDRLGAMSTSRGEMVNNLSSSQTVSRQSVPPPFVPPEEPPQTAVIREFPKSPVESGDSESSDDDSFLRDFKKKGGKK